MTLDLDDQNDEGLYCLIVVLCSFFCYTSALLLSTKIFKTKYSHQTVIFYTSRCLSLINHFIIPIVALYSLFTEKLYKHRVVKHPGLPFLTGFSALIGYTFFDFVSPFFFYFCSF